jgi:uncharacterized membrane protein YfcA
MSHEVFTLIIFSGAIIAGLIGSLTGLGGGIIIIPLLTLGLGVDIQYAIGAALISVIATSSGSAITFFKQGITNLRIGILLEVATTIGAIAGAFLTAVIPANAIAVMFGILLVFSSVFSLIRKSENKPPQESGYWAHTLKLEGSYTDNGRNVFYTVRNILGGFFMMTFAGIMSGLLGIGSGALKVMAMDNIMGMPFKVSTTTSSFMIGVTAVASVVIYLQRGYIVPSIAAPVMLGVLIGAITGAKTLKNAKTQTLKLLFTLIVGIIAMQMIYKGLHGSF